MSGTSVNTFSIEYIGDFQTRDIFKDVCEEFSEILTRRKVFVRNFVDSNYKLDG